MSAIEALERSNVRAARVGVTTIAVTAINAAAQRTRNRFDADWRMHRITADPFYLPVGDFLLRITVIGENVSSVITFIKMQPSAATS